MTSRAWPKGRRLGENVTCFNPPQDKPQDPPGHLEPPEQALWGALVAEFVIDDAASLETLALVCEARGRARRCRVKINENESGEVVKDRWGQLQRHPLLSSEAHAMGVFLSALRALRLDTTGESNK